MIFQHKRLISALALTGLLSACGGEDITAPSETTQPSQYSGKVTHENGAPAAGISVRLENRVTDHVTEAITSADGSFSAEVDPGIYDIIFDDKNAAQVISLKKTAINLQANQKDDVLLKMAHQLPENQLTGTMKNLDGTASAQRTLLILPAIARSKAHIGEAQLPNPFWVQTDAQGSFSTALGEAGMDFDFDTLLIAPGAPELDISKLAQGYEFTSQEANDAFHQTLQTFFANHVQESVDIEKPNGAMHVDLVIGSPTRNLRDSTGGPSAVPADEARLAAYDKSLDGAQQTSLQSAWNALKENTQNSLLKIIPSAHAAELFKKFSFHITESGKSKTGIFQNGELKPYGSDRFLQIDDINDGSFDPEKLGVPSDFGQQTKIAVNITRGFTSILYSYQVSIQRYKSGTYTFTDKTNDTYKLRIYRNADNIIPVNTVSYNSKSPEIIRISYAP